MAEELMTRKVKDICNEANNETALVIWEKSESRNGGNKKKQKKTNIAYPVIRTRTRAYQVVRNVCFSEN